MVDIAGGNHFVLNSYPTREIVLIAKRMDYMESHLTDQQHTYTREVDRSCRNKT
jgi:hypothetical protein